MITHIIISIIIVIVIILIIMIIIVIVIIIIFIIIIIIIIIIFMIIIMSLLYGKGALSDPRARCEPQTPAGVIPLTRRALARKQLEARNLGEEIHSLYVDLTRISPTVLKQHQWAF